MDAVSVPGFVQRTILLVAAAPPRVNPEEFTTTWHAAVERHAPMMDELTEAYQSVLDMMVKQSARRFTRYAQPIAHITSAAEAPRFILPSIQQVYDLVIAQLKLSQATGPIRTRIAQAIIQDVTTTLNLRFDLNNPLAKNVLRQMGQNIVGITESHRDKIMQIAQDGYDNHLSIADVAKNILTDGGVDSLMRATRISRTEFVGVANGSSHAAASMVGAKQKQWLSTNDNRVRPDHAEADGQVVPIDQPFDVGGAAMMYPGDPNGPPEETIQCRCVIVYPESEQGFSTPVAGQYGPGSPFAPGGENPNLAMPMMEPATLPVRFANETGLNAPLSDVIQQIMALHDVPPGWLQAQVETDETRHGLMSGEYTGDSFTPGGGKIGVYGIGRHERLSFAHEFGHWLDSAGAPGWISAGREASLVYRDEAGQWVSYDTDLQGAVKDFLRACRSTNSYQFFDSYYSKPHEMWARSYSQWIAEHAKNPDLLAELRAEQFKHPGAGPTKGGVWTQEEWAIVEPHVEAILRARGLIS